jgi:hypothetical protein
MPSYGSVPSEEYELESRSTLRDADRSPTPQTKQNVQIYVQVPKDEDAHSQPISGRFRELCVSRVVLLGLAFFFASSTLTIGLLYYFSQVDHGLTTAQNSHRYAWLYGPTAGKAKIHHVRQQLTSKSCDLNRRDLARDRS